MNLRQKMGFWKYLIASLIALSVTLAGTLLVLNMNFFGYRIPSPNISIDYIKGLFWAFILLFAIQFLPIPNLHKQRISLIWIIKLFVTLGAMLLYEKQYILDAYSYYKQSVSNSNHSYFIMLDGTLFIEWLGSSINSFFPYTNSYHALKVIWAFFGLMAIYIFYLAYEKVSIKKNKNSLLFIALFPSVLFWTSILGKDPLAFLGIALFTLGIAYLDKKQNSKAWALIACSFFLLFMVRFWLAPMLLGGLCFYTVFSVARTKIQRFLMFFTFAVIFYFSLTNMFSYLHIFSINDFIASINQNSRSWAEHGGSGQAPPSFNSLKDLVLFLPQGTFAALFRPLPGEINNLFGFLAGIENLLVLCLMFYVLRFGKGVSKAFPFINFCISYVALWSLFYAFISYQNLGTAFRFRLQVLPVLLIIYLLVREYKNQQIFESNKLLHFKK
ncbi:MAG: hypothetical protein H6625_13550 [Bdellovibrionaceae bacterium]|nr:hypothetical protein [Pseudobdellovibrionaceae bacterium]